MLVLPADYVIGRVITFEALGIEFELSGLNFETVYKLFQ